VNDLEQGNQLLVVFIALKILFENLKIEFVFHCVRRKLKLRFEVGVAPPELK
jgi:hypothetical protein